MALLQNFLASCDDPSQVSLQLIKVSAVRLLFYYWYPGRDFDNWRARVVRVHVLPIEHHLVRRR